MEFIFTPVSFKGTISAQRITELLEQASRKHFPQAKTHAVPVADGGKGT
jgi:glycerate 2-kinase